MFQNNDNLEPLTLNDEIENENSQSCSDSDDLCDNNDDLAISSKSSIFVDLVRTNYNNKKRTFCGKKRTTKNNKLHRISDKIITDAYIKTSILIPFGSRSCKNNFDEYGNLDKSCLGIIFKCFIYKHYNYIIFKNH